MGETIAWIVPVFFGSASVALAAPNCAAHDGPTYKFMPRNSAEAELAREKVRAGAAYEVEEQRSEWNRVSIGGKSVWARAGLFSNLHTCASAESTAGDRKSVVPRTVVSAAAHAPSKLAHREHTDCSCGFGQVCIGPRGGHYCITSSGGKRYGV